MQRSMTWQCLVRYGVLASVSMAFQAVGATGAEPAPLRGANYKQAFRFSSSFVRQFAYDTVVAPQWIGKTDCFWYAYRTSRGTSYWRVDPQHATKVPLFDPAKLAAALSTITHKPLDAAQLPLTRVSMNEDGTRLRFVVDPFEYEYDLRGEQLRIRGPAPPSPPQAGRQPEAVGLRRRFDDQQQRQAGSASGSAGDRRVFSPDHRACAIVRHDNLFLLKGGAMPLEGLLLPTALTSLPGVVGQMWSVAAGYARLQERKAIALSTDGTEEYSFGRMATFGSGMDDEIGPPHLEWSPDSKAFYATRVDSRGVQELFVVNSLSLPRPTLLKYKYPLPGEAVPRRMELYACDRRRGRLVHIQPKYRDEVYSDIH